MAGSSAGLSGRGGRSAAWIAQKHSSPGHHLAARHPTNSTATTTGQRPIVLAGGPSRDRDRVRRGNFHYRHLHPAGDCRRGALRRRRVDGGQIPRAARRSDRRLFLHRTDGAVLSHPARHDLRGLARALRCELDCDRHHHLSRLEEPSGLGDVARASQSARNHARRHHRARHERRDHLLEPRCRAALRMVERGGHRQDFRRACCRRNTRPIPTNSSRRWPTPTGWRSSSFTPRKTAPRSSSPADGRCDVTGQGARSERLRPTTTSPSASRPRMRCAGAKPISPRLKS